MIGYSEDENMDAEQCSFGHLRDENVTHLPPQILTPSPQVTKIVILIILVACQLLIKPLVDICAKAIALLLARVDRLLSECTRTAELLNRALESLEPGHPPGAIAPTS